MFSNHRDVLTRALRSSSRARIAAGGALVAGLLTGARATAAPAAELGVTPAVAERTLSQHPLTTLDGRSLTLGSLKGDVVVVNFWASWCPPCRRELPRLGKLEASLGGGSRLIAVSIDENADNARRFCTAQNLRIAVAHDGPDGLARSLDLQHVPLTLVLDRSGRIVYVTLASDERALAEVESAARKVLAQPAPTADAGDAR